MNKQFKFPFPLGRFPPILEAERTTVPGPCFIWLPGHCQPGRRSTGLCPTVGVQEAGVPRGPGTVCHGC